MTKIAILLYGQGYILRSGGAEGADSAFEAGAGDRKEIFLPWKGFNKNPSPLYPPSEKAIKMACAIHPLGDKLERAHKLLHGRNMHQVLGREIGDSKPSQFILCWTPGVGGTVTALTAAHHHHIPVFNLFVDPTSWWDDFLKISQEVL